MKRIVSLVLALAMVLSLCIFTTASADDGFVDGKFTKTCLLYTSPSPRD